MTLAAWAFVQVPLNSAPSNEVLEWYRVETGVAKRGLFRTVMGGAWAVFNGVRRTVFGVIALLILIVMIVGFGAAAPKPLKDKTALVIAFQGDLVEQFSGDPGELALAKALGSDVMETRLRDVKRALELAAKDKHIDRVLVRTDQLTGGGQASLREVASYIQEFKKASGKEVISYAYGYDQRGLFIAAQADKVYLHPEGLAVLEGLGRFRTYYKSMLDKLGVQMNVFRVGKFKSAVEPYLLDGPSDEAREADAYWLNDVWDRFLVDYAAARKLNPAGLKVMIDELPQRLQAVGGDFAKLALQEKLVDELKTPDQIRDLMISKGARSEDSDHPDRVDFRKIELADYLKLKNLSDRDDQSLPAIGVIVAEGGISDGKQPQGQIGGDSTAALVRRAREDDDIKAIVLRVDSPGGSGFASEIVRRELELMRAAKKPVYISMGDVAASGGYWISMTSDKIYASPSTITGSIGIFGLFPTVAEGLDKIGVHSGGTTTTWLAGALDPTRPLDPKLGETLQVLINHGYANFVGKVASNRKKTPEQINEIAQGRVWSGAQAKERGLVDEFGLLDDVVEALAKKANLTKFRVTYVEQEPDGLAMFFNSMGASALRMAATAFKNEALPKLLSPEMRTRVERDFASFAAAREQPFALYAHCLCDAE